MKQVYTDASSAILLYKAGLFEKTCGVFQVILPPGVFSELNRDGYPGAEQFAALLKDEKFQVRAPEESVLQALNNSIRLGVGEAQTISLFQASDTGFILTDDGPAARFCFKKRHPFINALLIPKIFRYAGIINKESCAALMKDLCRIGRYSEKIQTIAGNMDKKALNLFLPW